jgi:hypothetical protein
VGADRELREAWAAMDRHVLMKTTAENGLKWVFDPGDSLWYQGLVESRRLSPSEFLTLCSEVANLVNERPIGTLPSSDSEINCITPNSLLLGRSVAKNPGDWQEFFPSPEKLFHVVQSVVSEFWRNWVELCAPCLVVRHTTTRNLKTGDAVLVAVKNAVRGDYRLGLVKQVFPDKSGKIRRVTLSYKNFKVGETVHQYNGSNDSIVSRSVHRLALLVPAEEN